MLSLDPLAPVVCADAVDFLAGLETESVDAVVTDPPFGLGKYYDGTKEDGHDPVSYWSWLGPIVREMDRVLRPGGLLAVWQSQTYLPYFWDWFGSGIHIYVAAKNFVQIRPTPINSGWDPVVMRYKAGAPPLCPERAERSVDFFVADTASVVSDSLRPERAHPFPRPLDAAKVIIKNFTVPGGTVVDPFAGSGTIPLACLMEGRRVLGCEISEEFVRLANTRCSASRKRRLCEEV